MNKIKPNLLYLTLTIIGVSIVIIFLGTNIFNNKNVISNETNTNEYSNSLALMYETKYGSGEYKESANTVWKDVIDRGYAFNEVLSNCENGSILTWDEESQTVVYSGHLTDKCYVYFDKLPLSVLCNNLELSNCIKKYVYTEDGEEDIYYHDGIGIYGEYEAEDYSYRYSGANPDNYVCFGTDEETCPTDNLYRIIGIFNDNRVKLIKYDYATYDSMGKDGDSTSSSSEYIDFTYYKGVLSTIDRFVWNGNTSINIWNESNLNTVNLNTNYWSSLGEKWQNYIDDTVWIVGGNEFSSPYPKATYDYELINPATSDTYTAKIGLMYVSEFKYAVDPNQSDSWSSLKDYSKVHTYNWMSMGYYDWAITPRTVNDHYAYMASRNGAMSNSHVNYGYYYCQGGVRPTFNLYASVKYTGGTGTADDPFRI